MGLKIIKLANSIRRIIHKNGSRYITRSRKSNEFDAFLFYLLHTQKDISMDTSTQRATFGRLLFLMI